MTPTLPLTMYDSVTAADIPANVPMVSGYGWEMANRYRWSNVDFARFPTAVKIITVISAFTDDGDELDIETGDATPAQAPGWVRLRVAAGRQRVSLYMNRSTWPSVQQAVNAAGLSGHVVYRVAQYTGRPFSLPGAWAVQYADPATSGGHYDLSYVTDLSWLLTPTVGPPVQPAYHVTIINEEGPMAFAKHPTDAGRVDAVELGADGKLYHSARDDRNGDIIHPEDWPVVGPSVPLARVGGAWWEDNGLWCVVVDTSGQSWISLMQGNGAFSPFTQRGGVLLKV